MWLRLCFVGLEYLQTAVSHWEDALMKLSYVNDSPVPALQVGTMFFKGWGMEAIYYCIFKTLLGSICHNEVTVHIGIVSVLSLLGKSFFS